jgi:hypothetical protein
MILRYTALASVRSKLIMLGVLLAGVSLIMANAYSRSKDETRAIDYKIGKSFRTVAGPPTLIVYISVKPKRFNRDYMIILANELNNKFHDEKRVSVWVFDSYQSARDFVPHRHSPSYDRDFMALRGFYDLDRENGSESVSFASTRGKPRNEIEIRLSEMKRN